MNSRRSRSVKLVPARATKQPQLEVDVSDEDTRIMSSSAANTVYCCIARGRKVIYRYSSSSSKDGGGGDSETESTAALCLEHAPPYHRHYVHTSGSRSYAFLTTADDGGGTTFFAIIDPCVGSAGALQFLERVRDVFFRNAAQAQQHRNGLLHDDYDSLLVPAVQRLVASLEKMPHAAFVLDGDENRGGSNANDTACTSSSSSKVPLLGKSGSRNEKKKKKKSKEKAAPGDGHGTTRGGVRIDMPTTTEEVGGMSLERSTSQSRLRRQQQQQPAARSLWMRHVKVIVVVDAVICLVLFAAWLAVCKGFQCVSG